MSGPVTGRSLENDMNTDNNDFYCASNESRIFIHTSIINLPLSSRWLARTVRRLSEIRARTSGRSVKNGFISHLSWKRLLIVEAVSRLGREGFLLLLVVLLRCPPAVVLLMSQTATDADADRHN